MSCMFQKRLVEDLKEQVESCKAASHEDNGSAMDMVRVVLSMAAVKFLLLCSQLKKNVYMKLHVRKFYKHKKISCVYIQGIVSCKGIMSCNILHNCYSKDC
jgi:hypothetical protein